MKQLIACLFITCCFIACQKNKHGENTIPQSQDSTNTKPVSPGNGNDTNKVPTDIITTYTGTTHYTYNNTSPISALDSTYADHATVIQSFKDSTISFSVSFANKSFKTDFHTYDFFHSNGIDYGILCTITDSTVNIYYNVDRDEFQSRKAFNGKKD
jgi:hypothetical protein